MRKESDRRSVRPTDRTGYGWRVLGITAVSMLVIAVMLMNGPLVEPTGADFQDTADVTGEFTAASLMWWASGANTSNQWGDDQNSAGSINATRVWSGPVDPDTGEVLFTHDRVIDLSAGPGFGCAIVGANSESASGTVYCWGDNSSGQLGNGTAIDSDTPVAVMVSGSPVSGATDIATGDGHACAVTDGEILCWGANDKGQLGNGTTTPSSSAVEVTGDGGASLPGAAVKVTAGGATTCATTDVNGAAWCWGNNDHFQVGTETYYKAHSGSHRGSYTTAQKVLTWDEVTAPMVYNGSTNEWDSGTPGNPKYTYNDWMRSWKTTVPVADISTNGATTCAAVPAPSTPTQQAEGYGTFCWGSNANGQLGIWNPRWYWNATGTPTNTTSNKFAKVHELQDQSTPVKVDHNNLQGSELPSVHNQLANRVVVGSTSTCALVALSDASTQEVPYCWGRIGTGGIPGTFNPNGSPDTSLVAQIGAGAINGATIRQVSWGRGGPCNQLGGGPKGPVAQNQGNCPFIAAVRITRGGSSIPSAANATDLIGSPPAVAGQPDTYCAVASDQLYCWGGNAAGQLGRGTVGTTANTAGKLTPSTGTFPGVRAYSTGPGYTLIAAQPQGDL